MHSETKTVMSINDTYALLLKCLILANIFSYSAKLRCSDLPEWSSV